MRRAPDSDIPRQFLNDSSMNFDVGTVVIVLSKFLIFTVCNAMSITSPSALSFGISTQSPSRTMSLLAICTLATRDSIVSLNTNIRTAVMAPMPLTKIKGF